MKPEMFNPEDLAWYIQRDTSQKERDSVWRGKWKRVLVHVRKKKAEQVIATQEEIKSSWKPST